CEPPERVVATEWRRVQLLIRLGLEQARLAKVTAQLIPDELRPILNRTMYAARRAHHWWIVHGRTVFWSRFAIRSVWPGLVDLSSGACAPKASRPHLQGLEHLARHGAFPGLAGDLFHHRAGDDIAEVRVFVSAAWGMGWFLRQFLPHCSLPQR